MILILLLSLVNAGLNFADSIYSAVFYLSKTVDIYPLFPLIDEIAFDNQDKTIDYSTLIYGTETKYDAVNAYETLLYMNIPEVMIDGQKRNLTKSLYFIKDVDSPEMGEYCRTVYARIHQRFGTYLNLEPLDVTTNTTSQVSLPLAQLEDEIINEKRLSSIDDIMADDIVDRYTLGIEITPEFAESILESFDANILAYRTIGLAHGQDIFLNLNSNDNQVISTSIQTQATEKTPSILAPQNETILEKRETDHDLLSYEKAAAYFPSVLKDKKLNRALVEMTKRIGNNLGLEINPAVAVTASSFNNAYRKVYKKYNKSPFPYQAITNLYTDSALKSALNALSASENSYTALMVYFNLDFATSFVHGTSSNIKTLTIMANKYAYDDTWYSDNIRDIIYQAQIFSQQTIDESDRLFVEKFQPGELEKYLVQFGTGRRYIKGKGLTQFLLNRLESEFNKGLAAEMDKIMHYIELLNKMSFLTTTSDDLGVEIDGLSMHKFKQKWKTVDSKDSNVYAQGILDMIDHLKTPVDHLQKQIETLVADQDFVADLKVDTDDPAEFFVINQRALKKIAHKPKINLVLRTMVHSLNNMTGIRYIGEDIDEISRILIGNGKKNNHGLIGYSKNAVFRSSAKRLRANRVDGIKSLRSYVNIKFKRN